MLYLSACGFGFASSLPPRLVQPLPQELVCLFTTVRSFPYPPVCFSSAGWRPQADRKYGFLSSELFGVGFRLRNPHSKLHASAAERDPELNYMQTELMTSFSDKHSSVLGMCRGPQWPIYPMEDRSPTRVLYSYSVVVYCVWIVYSFLLW